MRWYADRGYLVISPDYTLATRGSATWDVAPHEIACAMAWTALHADTLHADLQRLAVGGDSAGATLAINAADTANQDLADTTCGAVPHVVATVVTSPIVDPIRTWNNTSVQGDAARSMLETYTGGSPLRFPDRYRAISCLTYIGSSSPPTLVIGGANDHLVPHAESVDFVRRLQAAGVHGELITVPYGDHTFDLTFGSIGHQLKLQLFDRFLKLRLAAE
jgi:acetyl esterase/lipase